MWECEGQHLYTNSWLHHCSAFDLVLMGHHPGQGWPSKTDLSVNFLVLFFHPKSFLSILPGFRSSACVFLDLFLPLLSPSSSSPPPPSPSFSSPSPSPSPPPSPSSSSCYCYWCFSLNNSTRQEPQCLHGTNMLTRTQRRRGNWSGTGYSHSGTELSFSSFISYLPSLSYTQTHRNIHRVDGWF